MKCLLLAIFLLSGCKENIHYQDIEAMEYPIMVDGSCIHKKEHNE